MQDYNRIWQAALGELKLQMTKATFDTWLANTSLIAADNGFLTIAVPNAYAKDWLEDRLRMTIERVLAGIVGHPVEVKFVVTPGQQPVTTPIAPEPEPQPEISVELVEYDPARRGWVQVSNYAIRFWMPYLGPEPFNLWLALRSFAYAADKATWPSIHTLAEITAGGDRQRIIGRKKDGRWVPGALEVLERERIVWYKRTGDSYTFRVLDSLPLLTPAQVQKLSLRLQRAHAHFVRQCELDYEEWEQLTLPTLAQVMGGDGGW